MLDLSTGKSQTLEFQCPKCAKRLKVGLHVAGRKVKCPQCGQTVRMPGIPAANTAAEKAANADDWLSLEEPLIVANPTQPATRANVRPTLISAPKQPAIEPAAAAKNSNNSATPRSVDTSPSTHVNKNILDADVPKNVKTPEPDPTASTRRSVFDDDLPDLVELEAAPQKSAVVDIFQLEGLDDLVSSSPLNSTKLEPFEEETNSEFRISCKVCGTPQYVKLDRVGKKTNCTDCHSSFTIPPPPPGWSPHKKKIVLLDDGIDVPLAPPEVLQSHNTLESQRTSASEYLANAKKELDDDEIDDLYQGEFDTAGFMQRTFGFVTDPGAISQVVLYGLMFAGLFALAQFSKNKIAAGGTEGSGYLLVFFILVGLIGVLVSMPMLSSGLTLLESVANRQRRVIEWPGFNLFDNFGEVLVILFALGGSLLPGMLVGGLIGRSGGAEWLTLTGMMGTCFMLFPILLLSMLDNGSIVQPISSSVIVSIGQVAEAWGGYYLKTMVAFGAVMVSWYLLLGHSPFAAALAGFLLPGLLFFTCQQVGALADAIAEHLSFEFTPPAKNVEETTDI